MAVITQTLVDQADVPTTITRTVLSASDTLVYTQGTNQQLFLYNTTASLVTVTINGTVPQTINVPGYGGTVSTAAGKAVGVPASSSVLVDLDDIYAYLVGTVSVTGGVGVTAHLYI